MSQLLRTLWRGEAVTAADVLSVARRHLRPADAATVIVGDERGLGGQLEGIAAAMPDDERSLLACNGIGPTKLERYGDDILAVLATVR